MGGIYAIYRGAILIFQLFLLVMYISYISYFSNLVNNFFFFFFWIYLVDLPGVYVGAIHYKSSPSGHKLGLSPNHFVALGSDSMKTLHTTAP